MKIFLVSNMYPSPNHPSYGVFIKNIVEEFEQRGVIFSAKAVIRGRGKNPFQKIAKHLSFYSSIIYYGLLRNYDAVYVHYITHSAIPVMLLRVFKKRKLIINVHGSDVNHLNSFVKFLNLFAVRLLRKAELVVAPSEFFRERMVNKYGLEAKKIFVSPSGGVNLDLFKPGKAKENKVFTIGYISRIDFGKGWDTLLHALRELIDAHQMENFRVIVVGDGNDREEFLSLLSHLELDEKITYLAGQPQEKLPAILHELDVFLFPTKREESLGLVGLEAMACGIPVIGSRIGGLQDYIIEGENGMFFEHGNAPELAARIMDYLNLNEKERSILKANAQKTALRFDNKKAIEELVIEMESIVL